MYCITDEQVEYILSDIRRNGVEMEDLQLNLLDHICCIMEQQLKENDDFERCYHTVIKQFYKKELREIEEETINLLTFKNYYAMKKLMIYSGAFSAVAFIIGSVLKIMHWPGAGIILCLATAVISFLFLPVLFLLKTRDTHELKDKIILGIGTLAGIMYCLSMLFLVQHWPGARVIWLSTLAISFFILVPLYFFSGIRRPETKVNTIVTTVLFMGFLGIQFTMTALRPSPEKEGRIYTYLQSEQLFTRAQLNAPLSSNKLAEDIRQTCQHIKELLLQREVGMPSIPVDFENRDIAIQERYIGSFFDAGEGRNLLASLREKVNRYNASGIPESSKIPVQNSILEQGFTDKPFCSNLFILNNITQLQLFITKAGSNPQAAVAYN